VRSHCNRGKKKGGMERQQMTTMRVVLEGRLMGYRTPGILNFTKPIIIIQCSYQKFIVEKSFANENG
jgi:hypothetical protein